MDGQVPIDPLSDAEKRTMLLAINRFARPDNVASALQVLGILGALAALFAAADVLPDPLRLLLSPLFGAVLLRSFVLQHDCGHQSLFTSQRANNVVGTLLSFLMGVGYEPWRHEHLWHHNHQGMLARRGIDRVNSPMTADEGRTDRASAARRSRLIRIVPLVVVFGLHSFLVKRKRITGYFFRREGFVERCGEEKALVRGLWVTNLGHLALHLACIARLGLVGWASTFLLGVIFSAGCGVLLFWVQHNFEHTYHADADAWRFADAGLRGSSYVALPAPLEWISGWIGLHHVHHLAPRVPNYRLDEARRAVPALAAMQPLSGRDFRRSFSHVFWDRDRKRMVSLDELFG